MLELIFTIFMFGVIARLALFVFRAGFGLTRVVLGLVLMPITLVFVILLGLFKLMFPLLMVAGLINLLFRRRSYANL